MARPPEPGLKDASHLYDVERRALHAERPGFRITELQIGPRQQVPWHYHTRTQDTVYVLEGRLRVFLRDPKEEVRLGPGEIYTIRAGRPISSRTAAKPPPPSSCSRASGNTTTSR